MTVAGDILDMVEAALLGVGATSVPPVYATDAGARVYCPGDWPTQGGQYPIIKLSIPRDSKQSLSRSGAPHFTVVTTIRIIGEVSELADVNDAGASAARAALMQLARQIEVAVIGSYPLFSVIQQLSSVDSQLAYNSDAETHLAGIQIDMSFEYYQGAEDFAPIAAEPIEEVALTLPNYPPTGFQADIQQ